MTAADTWRQNASISPFQGESEESSFMSISENRTFLSLLVRNYDIIYAVSLQRDWFLMLQSSKKSDFSIGAKIFKTFRCELIYCFTNVGFL